MSLLYTTPEFLKESLQSNVDFSLYTSGILNSYISAASRMIDNYTQRKFYVYSGVQEEHEVDWSSDGFIIVRPKQFPILEITKLEIRYAPTITPINVDLTYVEVFKEEGYLRYIGGCLELPPVRRITQSSIMRALVTYTAGYNTPPPEIEIATSLIVSNMLKSNNDINGGSREVSKEKWGASDYSVEYATGKEQPTQDYFTPNISSMLQMYARSSFF